MKKLVIASANKGKIAEIKEILKDFYEVVSMNEMGFNEEIIESGLTFAQNALIKAKTVSNALNLDTLSDDSGLCVESLNGAPGVYSARFSGVNATDKKNNVLLLEKLRGEENRRAKFVSVVCLYKTDGEIIYGNGKVSGKILNESKGLGGFGYDPLFYSYELNKTFGEASNEEKNSISHRYKALMDLKSKLK